MDESFEVDLRAARLGPRGMDEAAWTDAYVTSVSRLDALADPVAAATAAREAWPVYGWARPDVVAWLHAESRLVVGHS